jgi:hypothetical protein
MPEEDQDYFLLGMEASEDDGVVTAKTSYLSSSLEASIQGPVFHTMLKHHTLLSRFRHSMESIGSILKMRVFDI